MIGSTDEDVLVLEESDDNVHVNLRHTKDFRFVTVNTFSTTSSKVNALRETKGLLELIY
jgi:protease II